MNTSMILYPINVESAPNWIIRKAFTKGFSPFEEYDWVNIAAKQGLQKTQEDFLAILASKKPDYCFMQLQNPINMSVDMIKEMAKHTKIINWCGDIRQTPEWYNWFCDIGREIYLTLFTNETDVDILRSRGVRADYLQVGFDNVWYQKQPKDTSVVYPDIVFCGNNYGSFQLSQYRTNAAKALRKEFGEKFMPYGMGWDNFGIHTRSINNIEEARLYNNCKIAISISNFRFKRYHSDRLLRIMGCGCFALSHDYENLEKDYVAGHDLEVFYSIEELIYKCKFYLDNEEKRMQIAESGYLTAHSKCTWDKRVRELKTLLKKYD